ncbi:hypothetical protein CSKR_104360 [Clonorchis sinensis]|uniref:Uncharacterized protein n=1 Tax=Clonorchis sinensis TaxID=79923 RepID=A0A3R7CJR8_CLOSI|nr:hypothetical protein CSKR_104360 [Clonorchis sinensis]
MWPVPGSPSRKTSVISTTEFAGSGFYTSLPSHCLTASGSFPPLTWLCDKTLRGNRSTGIRSTWPSQRNLCNVTSVKCMPDREAELFRLFYVACIATESDPGRSTSFAYSISVSGSSGSTSTPQALEADSESSMIASTTKLNRKGKEDSPSCELCHLATNYPDSTWTLRKRDGLEREFTDRKVCGSNPTSTSRPPLSRLGQPGSIPALVLPLGGMAARHREGVTTERLFTGVGMISIGICRPVMAPSSIISHGNLSAIQQVVDCSTLYPFGSARVVVSRNDQSETLRKSFEFNRQHMMSQPRLKQLCAIPLGEWLAALLGGTGTSISVTRCYYLFSFSV